VREPAAHARTQRASTQREHTACEHTAREHAGLAHLGDWGDLRVGVRRVEISWGPQLRRGGEALAAGQDDLHHGVVPAETCGMQ
jgi:hypothetical protein